MLRAIRFLWRFCRARNEEDSGAPLLPVEKNYEIGEVIGRGWLGVVHKCTRRSTGVQLACKKMPITDNAYNEMFLLLNHLSGKHRGILKVRACYWPQLLDEYRWSKNLYMISELCHGGDLQRFLERNGILSERESAKIMKCIVEALQYCHSQGIIHRDVKPSSILISKRPNSGLPWVVKLGNFDRSIQLHGSFSARENVGTLGYSAPEMLIGNGYSYEVDIWSAGVVLYALLCGGTPFDSENDDAISMYDQIENTEVDVSSGVWSSVSVSAKELVLGMMEKKVDKRLSCDEILSHPWILGNAEMGVVSSSTAGNAEIGVVSCSTVGTEIVGTSGVDVGLQD